MIECRNVIVLRIRHNIAPHSRAPVVRRRNAADTRAGPSSDNNAPNDELIMQTMKWGLVPHWSKHEDKTLNTTNARSENLVEGGGMWGSLKGKKRCAIPCEGCVVIIICVTPV